MTPHSEAELCEIISTASTPLRIKGGGTRQALGNAVASTEQLGLEKLSGITTYEPGALTLVAKAGTPLTMIEETLAQERQQLAFEPIDHRKLLGTKGQSTIGAVAACNISGPRRLQAGACRDSLIGIRAVDGLGKVFKNGGRVMKNVTGYDLVKLLAGSFGTLGVISEVSFKVQPKPVASATIVLHRQNLDQAIALMTKALGSPNDISAAAFIPTRQEVYLRIEGLKGSVSIRTDALRSLFAAEEITVINGPSKGAKLWSGIGAADDLAGHKGDIWRISTKPSDAPLITQRIQSQTDAQFQYDWGGGLIWAAVPEGFDLRGAVAPLNGHAFLLRGDHMRAFHPLDPILETIQQGLRAKFDPKQVLNPGIMG